jgi:putative glycerol-1-phosphate prenyltransferase
MNVQDYILTAVKNNKKLLAILIDPDKFYVSGQPSQGHLATLKSHPPQLIFVGGSLMTSENFDKTIITLKEINVAPVVIFPGASDQINDAADSILNLSLLSGRNPEYLIGQQVKSAYRLYRSTLEILPTGYILIDSGKPTSVSYISNTQPIPSDKPEIAVATALAGQQMGKSLIYLEGGSGASNSINSEVISAVRTHITIPLIVGGGINTPNDVVTAWNAGADIVVIGTAFEKDVNLLHQIAKPI